MGGSLGGSPSGRTVHAHPAVVCQRGVDHALSGAGLVAGAADPRSEAGGVVADRSRPTLSPELQPVRTHRGQALRVYAGVLGTGGGSPGVGSLSGARTAPSIG